MPQRPRGPLAAPLSPAPRLGLGPVTPTGKGWGVGHRLSPSARHGVLRARLHSPWRGTASPQRPQGAGGFVPRWAGSVAAGMVPRSGSAEGRGAVPWTPSHPHWAPRHPPQVPLCPLPGRSPVHRPHAGMEARTPRWQPRPSLPGRSPCVPARSPLSCPCQRRPARSCCQTRWMSPPVPLTENLPAPGPRCLGQPHSAQPSPRGSQGMDGVGHARPMVTWRGAARRGPAATGHHRRLPPAPTW